MSQLLACVTGLSLPSLPWAGGKMKEQSGEKLAYPYSHKNNQLKDYVILINNSSHLTPKNSKSHTGHNYIL